MDLHVCCINKYSFSSYALKFIQLLKIYWCMFIYLFIFLDETGLCSLRFSLIVLIVLGFPRFAWDTVIRHHTALGEPGQRSTNAS